LLARGGSVCCDLEMRIVLAWMVAIVTVVTVLGLGGGTAEAMCASPRAGFSPPPGTTLPAKATVFLFVPSSRFGELPPPTERELTVSGGSFTARLIATTGLYSVLRVDVVASGASIEVGWKPAQGDQEAVSVGYRIGAVARDMAIVTNVTHTDHAWSCSHRRTIDITLSSSAIAYQFDWEDGTSTMVPPNLDVFWRGGVDSAAPPDHTIELGHLNCMGDDVEPAALARLRGFRLVALFSDGSERRFGRAEAQLGAAGVRLPRELVHTAAEPHDLLVCGNEAPIRELREAHAAAEARAAARSAWEAFGALAGATVVFAGGLLWRRRRRHDHLPRY
jgi:hypothetical protein